jgi:hypothetical protein
MLLVDMVSEFGKHKGSSINDHYSVDNLLGNGVGILVSTDSA